MKRALLLFLVALFFSGKVLAARTVISATVDGSSSTTVPPSATISALVNVTTTGNGSNGRWRSTGWRIAGSSGPLTCENHSNHNSAGNYTETFNITAPAIDGTYNLYLVAYRNNSCSQGASGEFILPNAVIVNSSCATFRDEFSTESYSRQDGTANWSTNWNEVGDNGAVSNGDIEISNGKLQLEGDGTGSTTLGAPYIEREADLSSYTTATLSFDYSTTTGNWENTDDIEIYVSSNGGSNWTLIHTFTDEQGSSTQQFSQDISAYIASNTRIAFVEKATADNEKFFFDNVQISACDTATANPTVNSLTTIDTTPILTGTFNSTNSAGGFTIEVNSVTYTLGSSSELTNSGDNWTLDLSNITPLSLGTYDVVATADDGAGTVLSDTTSNELTIEEVSTCFTFRDEFSTASYSRQDGTANWSTNWDEYEGTSATIPEASPNPTSGHVRIVGGQLVLNNYSPESQNFPGVERELDLSSFSSATFSFDFVTSGNVDSSDSLVVMASANGGVNWAVLEDIRGINDTSGSKNYNLTPYISSNTKIRIRFNNETVSGLGSGCCYGASPETFSVDNVQIEACAAGSGVGDTAATAFNCVENGSNGISGKLFTKTTAQSFSFDIVALQDASTIETSFASGADHTVSVELVDASSGNCSTYSSLSPSVSQNLLFTASDSGTKASAAMSSSAHNNVKCRVTDNTDSPAVVGCSTDSFAIRPTNFNVTSNLTNSGSSGLPTAKAGENFTLTVTAATGYTGTPTIDNAKIEAHAGAVQTGSLTGGFGAADSATGAATGSGFTYSEVGSLRFATQGVYDASFTVVDQSADCTDDFSNTPDVNGKVGCKFGNTSTSNFFGRFTPDHLDVTLNTPVFNPGCSTFSYLGQPVRYATQPIATVTAKNSAGTTTQNYTGNFWKIDPTDAVYGITPSYSEAVFALSVLESSPPSFSDSGNGTGLLTFADTSSDILTITKNTLAAPFNAEIALSFTLSDTDSIVVANVDGTAQVNPVTFGAASSGNGISFSGGNKTHRWGRFVLDSAHGSELIPLSIATYAEYYNGSDFVKNTADNCTTFSLATNYSISDPKDFDCSLSTNSSPVAIGSGSVKATMANTTVINGETEITISDNTVTTNGPGAGNTGYLEITSDLTNLSWLRYDWDADSAHDNCPSARATFGIYKGNSKQIYFREVY